MRRSLAEARKHQTQRTSWKKVIAIFRLGAPVMVFTSCFT
jgi:hypothetical protein